MGTVIVPVVVAQKECTIIHGDRYCKSEETTKQDVGYICLITLLLIAWIFVMTKALYEWGEKVAASIFLAPFVLGIILGFMT